MSCLLSNETCPNDGKCINHTCICRNACFTGLRCETYFNILELPMPSVILIVSKASSITYIIVFLILSAIGLANNLAALITLCRERLRITNLGLYLILFCSSNILAMILLSMNVVPLLYNEKESHLYWQCFPSAYISLTLNYMFNYLSVAIIIERVLIECYDFNLTGSRKRACTSSLLTFLIVAASNLPEWFARVLRFDPQQRLMCMYNPNKDLIWYRLQCGISYIHVILPCLVHLVSILCILNSIARRKIFIGIYSTEQSNIYYVWWKQLYSHRDLLLPPLIILICTLPHGIIHYVLLGKCATSDHLAPAHLHLALLLFLHLPAVFAFLIYIYPNNIYWREFQGTIIYRRLCFCCGCSPSSYRRQSRINFIPRSPRANSFEDNPGSSE